MYQHRLQTDRSLTFTIKSITSTEWRSKIVKAPTDKILDSVKNGTEWKHLRHDCTNYDKLVSSNKFKSLNGIERVVAYWTLHYYCTLIGIQEQVTYFRNRYETCLILIDKYRKELTKLNNELDSVADLKYRISELEKENAEMKRERTSLRKSIGQYKVWNERYRKQLLESN